MIGDLKCPDCHKEFATRDEYMDHRRYPCVVNPLRMESPTIGPKGPEQFILIPKFTGQKRLYTIEDWSVVRNIYKDNPGISCKKLSELVKIPDGTLRDNEEKWRTESHSEVVIPKTNGQERRVYTNKDWSMVTEVFKNHPIASLKELSLLTNIPKVTLRHNKKKWHPEFGSKVHSEIEKCPVCGRLCRIWGGLASHIRGAHPDRYNEYYPGSKFVLKSRDRTKKCPVCGEQFHVWGGLACHIRGKHPDQYKLYYPHSKVDVKLKDQILETEIERGIVREERFREIKECPVCGQAIMRIGLHGHIQQKHPERYDEHYPDFKTSPDYSLQNLQKEMEETIIGQDVSGKELENEVLRKIADPSESDIHYERTEGKGISIKDFTTAFEVREKKTQEEQIKKEAKKAIEKELESIMDNLIELVLKNLHLCNKCLLMWTGVDLKSGQHRQIEYCPDCGTKLTAVSWRIFGLRGDDKK